MYILLVIIEVPLMIPGYYVD